jgi:hypothetical protein
VFAQVAFQQREAALEVSQKQGGVDHLFIFPELPGENSIPS